MMIKGFKIILYFVLALIVIVGLYAVFTLTPRDVSGLLQRSERIEVNGVERHYNLYDPAPEKDNKPVVFAFHGLGDRAKWMELYTGLSNLARDEEFVVLYPKGLYNSWNGTICCGRAYKNQVDDLSFVRAMVDKLKTEYNVDESRFYAVGFSNGGLFTQKLLAEQPEIFAAGASAMAGVGDNKGNMLDLSEAIAPIMLMNGTMDQYSPLTMPRNNVNSFQFYPAEQSWQKWVGHYDLGEVALHNEGNNPDVMTYGDSQVVTKLYDSQHRWPQWRLWSFRPTVPQSTREMWDFLSQHTTHN